MIEQLHTHRILQKGTRYKEYQNQISLILKIINVKCIENVERIFHCDNINSKVGN